MSASHILMIIFFMTPSALSIIAYDCLHHNANMTTISSLTVAPCISDNIVNNQTTEQILLLQLSETSLTHVYQCKINVVQHIFRCGMWSHTSEVSGGLSTYLESISSEQCRKIHETGYYAPMPNTVLSAIKPNSTYQSQYVAAGSLSSDVKNDGKKLS